jgi:hypothetical protein
LGEPERAVGAGDDLIPHSPDDIAKAM